MAREARATASLAYETGSLPASWKSFSQPSLVNGGMARRRQIGTASRIGGANLRSCCVAGLGDGSRRPPASRRERKNSARFFFFLTNSMCPEFLTTLRLNTNTSKRKRVGRPIPIPRTLFAARAPRPWPCARGPPKCRGKRGYTNQFKEASESTTPLYARSTVAG